MENGDPRDHYDEDKTDDELIEEAKAFYIDDLDFESQVRDNMEVDMRMSNNEDGWEPAARNVRTTEKRPMLSIPRFNQFLNQIKNEQRQNKPSIKVSPRGANDENIQKQREKAAENRQGLIRFIQYGSQATDAYQLAFDFAVDCGRGFFRIESKDVGPDSFDKEIVINPIPNPLDVVMDSSRLKADYSDCKRGFIIDRLTRPVFKNEYPDANPVSWSVETNNRSSWVTRDEIYVVEYFCIRHEKKTLLGLDDGETIYKEDMASYTDEDKEAIMIRVEREREVKIPYVMWYKMTSDEILDREKLPGTFIPIIPVIGTEKNVAGKLEIKGLMRDMRDTVRAYNLWASLETEVISLAPKSPYIMAEGQQEGYEKMWKNANTRSYSALIYKPVSSGNKPVAPPQRVPFAGVPTGILQAKLNLIEDQKAITGLWDASLGAQGNESSGKAILARERQGSTATYHYIDNMRCSLAHAGVIINEWLPVIYDTARLEKILGEDGDESTINLGGQDDEGNNVELGSGKFDVVVTMGPSFNTQRQEAAESMMQFIQAYPPAAQVIGDLIAKNMDWRGAPEIAERLKKMVPPEILEENGGEEQMARQIQELQGQLQQAGDMVEQQGQAMQELEKQAEGNELDSDTKIEVANIKAESDLIVANIKAGVEVQKSKDQRMEKMFSGYPSNTTSTRQ